VKRLALIAALVLIWTTGLFAFADRVARLTPAEEPRAAEGIVALTGASDRRLTAATVLLMDGKARRLLISGVNRMASRDDVWAITGGPKPLFDCCVDLGFVAADTIGNARETAEWAKRRGFRSLILVTADYHMPRALLELKGALPAARITPYPVATASLDARHWLASGAGARRMTLEYCKYLAVLTREAVLRLWVPAPQQTKGAPPA
jgi:uncharacterized SAM-binding protein YcdF (DUF218 family)